MSEIPEIHPLQLPSTEVRAIKFDWNLLIVFLASGIFIFSCYQIDLTQDDAYISFRYAANYLNGEGLVYNHGERVEGYTNFLWVILLALFKGVFGIDYLIASRLIGIGSGIAIFLLLYVLLKQHYTKVPLLLHASLAVAMLSNLSLPYWSSAGLETSAFACLVLAAIIAEYRRPHLTPALLVIATLLRPEGVIVFAAILINRIIKNQGLIWYYCVVYTVLLVPFAVFKLAYYGSLLPNSYYAKSGIGLEYIQSGLEYCWHFTQTLGVYGIIFVVPLLAVKRLWNRHSVLYLCVLLYGAYIVWIGGDVLRAHRFFVPVVPLLYFLFVISLAELISHAGFRSWLVYGAAGLGTIAFSFGSYSFSHTEILMSRDAEKNLIRSMHCNSMGLKNYGSPDFTLAASTIGIVGYELLGHRVIDMLGLTDRTIARNPEEVNGMFSAWKERRFNSRYLLEQQPDYILFSTGYKPSAPAERALLLHSEFRRGYSSVCYAYNNRFVVAWRRKRPLEMRYDVVNRDLECVDKYIEGCDHLGRGMLNAALADFRESRSRFGEDFPALLLMTGQCFLQKNELDSASAYYQKALALDTLCPDAHLRLLYIARWMKDTTAFIRHAKSLRQTSPWVFGE